MAMMVTYVSLQENLCLNYIFFFLLQAKSTATAAWRASTATATIASASTATDPRDTESAIEQEFMLSDIHMLHQY